MQLHFTDHVTMICHGCYEAYREESKNYCAPCWDADMAPEWCDVCEVTGHIAADHVAQDAGRP